MMRFPLIVMVLYIHAISSTRIPIKCDLSSMNLFTLLSESLSHNIFSIAVPCFFIFSSYYYFYKLEKSPDADWYKKQGLKRIKTLLIPYIVWNLVLVLAIIAKNGVFHFMGLEYDSGWDYLKKVSWGMIMWVDPINFPLWYLRDLICMTLLAPIFYIWLHRTGLIGILLLFVFYLYPVESTIPGFSQTAIFYYGLGAYMGINKKNILLFCHKWRICSYMLAILLLIIAISTNGKDGHVFAEKIFIPFGLISFFNIINSLVDKDGIRKFLCNMSPTVFFIYAIHEVYIYNWVNGFFVNKMNSYEAVGGMLTYIFKPIVVLLICLTIYQALKKLSPRLLNFMIGGRVLPKQ